jgi:hypothetical protein
MDHTNATNKTGRMNHSEEEPSFLCAFRALVVHLEKLSGKKNNYRTKSIVRFRRF